MKKLIIVFLLLSGCQKPPEICNFYDYLPRVCTEEERKEGGYYLNTCITNSGEVKEQHFVPCEDIDRYFEELTINEFENSLIYEKRERDKEKVLKEISNFTEYRKQKNKEWKNEYNH